MRERIRVPIRVIPRASANVAGGLRGGRLVVRVSAAPVDGAANRVALRTLAAALGLREAAIRLEAGAGSPDKVVSVPAGARGALDRLRAPEA